MSTKLKVRNFVKGEDEEAWLSIGNEADKQFEDHRLDTMEDMEISERHPSFDETGMFIAELDGKPVGRVDAHIDRYREEKKGFIQRLGVIPKFRRRGIGRTLANKAIQSLTERGMEKVESWAREDQPAYKHLLESMGFKTIRVFSTMRRDLANIPSNIGENKMVKVRTMKEGSGDIRLLNWITNETFKDHFDFRPSVIEEWEHWCSEPDFDPNGWFFALLEDEVVGYVGTWIDSKFIRQKGIKKGWIDTVAVLKPYRRRGIGTTLILLGMEYLKSKGMTVVELEVDDTNPTGAVELYKRVGFKSFRKVLTYLKKIT